MQSPVLSLSPSFNSYSSTKFGEICDKIRGEINTDPPDEPENDQDFIFESNPSSNAKEDEEFEFGSVDSSVDSFEPIFADEIFSNGQIRPLFRLKLLKNPSSGEKPENGEELEKIRTPRIPLRQLLFEDREPSESSSESDELDGIPAGTYCVWRPRSPSRETCKKSSSTGSSRRWKFRDLLVRSNSDGKEQFVFFREGKPVKKPAENMKTGKAKVKPVAGDVSGHHVHYVRNRVVTESDRKKSFLPYRQDLLGFFSSVNGFTRNLHPFAT